VFWRRCLLRVACLTLSTGTARVAAVCKSPVCLAATTSHHDRWLERVRMCVSPPDPYGLGHLTPVLAPCSPPPSVDHSLAPMNYALWSMLQDTTYPLGSICAFLCVHCLAASGQVVLESVRSAGSFLTPQDFFATCVLCQCAPSFSHTRAAACLLRPATHLPAGCAAAAVRGGGAQGGHKTCRQASALCMH
jgi:hypothetical protein